MFNRTFVRQGDHVHTTVEQLPPNSADAARLYGEMITKAREEVKNAVVREAGASIRVLVQKMESETNFSNLDVTIRVMFSVNGDRYEVKTTEESWRHDVFKAIAEHVTEQVIRQLTEGKRL